MSPVLSPVFFDLSVLNDECVFWKCFHGLLSDEIIDLKMLKLFINQVANGYMRPKGSCRIKSTFMRAFFSFHYYFLSYQRKYGFSMMISCICMPLYFPHPSPSALLLTSIIGLPLPTINTFFYFMSHVTHYFYLLLLCSVKWRWWLSGTWWLWI